jgi:hypothetical protein
MSLFMAVESPKLNLKVGEVLFSIDKTSLPVGFKLFTFGYPRQFIDEYEVQTPVTPTVFQDFMDYVNGKSVTLSEENCETFWYLADEFGMDSIADKCDEFMGLPSVASMDSKQLGEALVYKEVEVGPGHRVKLTVGVMSETYDTLRSIKEIHMFTFMLRRARKEDIVIEGIEGRDRLVEKAVAAVYANAVVRFPEGRVKRQFLVITLWVLQKRLICWSIDSAIYCLNKLNEIAPTRFDKAKHLLLSQFRPLSRTELVPMPKASEIIISDAIEMLTHEKGVRMVEANELLRRVKATGQYNMLFEDE